MKVIFPFTENAAPFVPHTDQMGDPLPQYEGQPTLAHLLQPLCKLPVSEFIFIADYPTDPIQAYMEANHSGMPASFIQQTQEKGLGHSVSLASNYISDEPLLIVEAEASVSLNWTAFTQSQRSTIAVRRIVDEKPYGLVELREGIVGCLIQKPRRTDLVIAGCYFIRESKLLFACLHDLIQAGHRRNGKYQLTNALQRMIDYGVEIQVQEVKSVGHPLPYESSNFFGTDFEALRSV